MEFELIPQCPTTTVGGIGSYIDYDPNDGVVATKQDFFSMSGSTVTQIWQEQRIRVNTN